MRVAQVAPLWTRVPPEQYGGAELMVHWLTEELVRRHHDVTLFASADSETSARLVPVCMTSIVDAMRRGDAYQYDTYAVSALARALQRADEFDVIHAHIGPVGIPFSGLTATPIVHTVHAGLDSVDEHWLLDHHPDARVVAISDSQVATVDAARRRSIPTVYHGLDLTPYNFSKDHDGYVLFLGRMGPNKNPAGAIRIARAAGFPIVLAGAPQNGKEKCYFDEAVRPLLSEPGVTYAGPVSLEEKVDLLRGAAALVFPIQWEEHFGLVMIEAMACGTPVVAFERGSVPEVISCGTTGFYGSSEAELIEALPVAAALDRAVVQQVARDRFSVERMTGDYERVYVDAVRERG